MKIDDLKPNARLVLKGPLVLANFKVGEIAIVDSVGSESVTFKGMFVLKRDIVLERFVTEPEWKEIQDSLKKPVNTESIQKQLEELNDKLTQLAGSITLLMGGVEHLVKWAKMPQAPLSISDLLPVASPAAARVNYDAVVGKLKRKKIIREDDVISPGQPSINGMLILINANKPLTEKEWREGYQKEFSVSNTACGITWHYMKKQKLVCEVFLENSAEPHYRVSVVGRKINSPGRYQLLPNNEIKVIQEGETSGKAYAIKRGEVSVNGNGKAH